LATPPPLPPVPGLAGGLLGGALLAGGVTVLGVDVPPPVLLTEGVEALVDAAWVFLTGFCTALSAGTDASAPSAVTVALGAGTETAGASEALLGADELGLVSAPIANAAPNDTAAARISINQRFLTAVASAGRAVAPKFPCTAALLSISQPLRSIC
jgi:hypothetical protein